MVADNSSVGSSEGSGGIFQSIVRSVNVLDMPSEGLTGLTLWSPTGMSLRQRLPAAQSSRGALAHTADRGS